MQLHNILLKAYFTKYYKLFFNPHFSGEIVMKLKNPDQLVVGVFSQSDKVTFA